jgi:hypothetical protein
MCTQISLKQGVDLKRKAIYDEKVKRGGLISKNISHKDSESTNGNSERVGGSRHNS